jgi:hypothetical protein
LYCESVSVDASLPVIKSLASAKNRNLYFFSLPQIRAAEIRSLGSGGFVFRVTAGLRDPGRGIVFGQSQEALAGWRRSAAKHTEKLCPQVISWPLTTFGIRFRICDSPLFGGGQYVHQKHAL